MNDAENRHRQRIFYFENSFGNTHSVEDTCKKPKKGPKSLSIIYA